MAKNQMKEGNNTGNNGLLAENQVMAGNNGLLAENQVMAGNNGLLAENQVMAGNNGLLAENQMMAGNNGLLAENQVMAGNNGLLAENQMMAGNYGLLAESQVMAGNYGLLAENQVMAGSETRNHNPLAENQILEGTDTGNDGQIIEGNETRNDELSVPDLPTQFSVDDMIIMSSFISLNVSPSHIEIRQEEPQHSTTANNMTVPSSELGNVNTLQMHHTNRSIGSSNLLVNEISEQTQLHLQGEIIEENYVQLVRTFHNWPHHFLDPEVLAEAKFCYTGHGDTVNCTVCGGTLSNWKPGDDPRLEHLRRFGFLCQ